MSILRLAILLLLASSTLASPVITSVTPSEGRVDGGTRVVIRGSGFSDHCICSPPFGGLFVYFGATPSPDVDLIDETTIEAVTPAHLPGTVSVTVHQMDGSEPDRDVFPNGFTFTGVPEQGFEPVLFPIFMPPVRGAFGSEFHTTARMASRIQPFDVYGVDTSCTTIDPPIDPYVPFRIGTAAQELFTGCSDSVGRVMFVPFEHAEQFVAGLRVADVTRQRESHGVEIPVVREKDFVRNRIVLLGVPIDPLYRNTLRIYGLPGEVDDLYVRVNGKSTRVTLPPARNVFEPRYVQFTDFPALAELPPGQTTVTVVVEDVLGGRGFAGSTRFWAFVSVTNNATQEITTVTPN